MFQCISFGYKISSYTDFSHVLQPKIEKMGTLNKKWGPNGDPKSEKGPHGDPGPQMGTHVGAVLNISTEFCLTS